MTNPRQRLGSQQLRWMHLGLIIESDRPLAGGGRYSLQGIDQILVGRRERRATLREYHQGKAGLFVAVPNPRMSRSHFRLTREPSGWILEDLSSKNGTDVNGLRVVDPVAIHPGDIIQAGYAFFTLSETVASGEADLAGDVDSEAEGAKLRPLSGFPTLVPLLSEQLRRLLPAIESADPIVIVGETGTGKEVLANAMHAASGRAGPFVPVVCGGLAPNLVEGQLFGFVRGAYSGAHQGDPGFVRLADGGTLLLDEILDLPLGVQAKLLRVIQQNDVVSLGSSRSVHVDVRFLAATQRPLGEVVTEGLFRADLQARLERHVIVLPPLRERIPDLGVLVAAILRAHGGTTSDGLVLPPQAVVQMLSYSFPLNVRELENNLVRALRSADEGVLDAGVFPVADRPLGARVAVLSPADQQCRQDLIASLKKNRGNVARVSRDTGLHREQIYRALRRFSLNPRSFRNQGRAPDGDRHDE